jgi:histidinol dehydrogenase
MKILRFDAPDFAGQLRSLQRSSEPDPNVEKTVRAVLQAIRAEGDEALIRFTKKFGGPTLSGGDLLVCGKPKVDARVKEAIATSHANVLAFSRRSLRENWTMKNAQGALVGERFDPFERVGVYVPGGTAPLVSTAIMTCTLAQAAGCPQIAVTTPSGPDGRINDALHHALLLAGATEIYRVGGAQAIGALAYGTDTIRPVQKIFGPGNAYVVEAKRQVVGRVAIDLLPGPSEILILADSTANPAWIASDLLAQAEHGKGSQMILVTNSAKLLAAVEKQVAEQIASLTRQEHLAGVLEHGAVLVLVRSLKDATMIANDYAPEHLSIVAKDELKIAHAVRTAGAIFLGVIRRLPLGIFSQGRATRCPRVAPAAVFPGSPSTCFSGVQASSDSMSAH